MGERRGREKEREGGKGGEREGTKRKRIFKCYNLKTLLLEFVSKDTVSLISGVYSPGQ